MIAPSDVAPVVEATDLAVRLPRTGEVLARSSFRVERGEFVAVVGPSGCGKSTLLRVLAGLVKASAGAALVDGREPRAARRDGGGLGMVFQQPALLPWRTIARNVMLPADLGTVPRRDAAARAEELLGRMDLTSFAAAYPHELSGGMRMRAALVRALVTSPRLLLLDEPFAALDFLTREDLQVLLRGLHVREGLTTILVTHDVTEAAFLADRVLVLSPRPGRVVAEVDVPLGKDRGGPLRNTPGFTDAARTIRDRLRWSHQ